MAALRLGLHGGTLLATGAMVYVDVLHGYDKSGTRIFGYHPMLMSTAYLLFMAQVWHAMWWMRQQKRHDDVHAPRCA